MSYKLKLNAYGKRNNDVKSKKAIRIYTESYSPFIMGGDVHQPIACETKSYTGPYKLNKGVQVYVCEVNGKTYVVEKTTGALVGGSLKMVTNDIKAAKKSVIQGQIREAKERATYARKINEEEFWRMMR